MYTTLLFGVIYLVLALMQLYSFMRAHENDLKKRERELTQREIELNKIEHWLDSRYDRIERITNHEIRN